MKSDNTLINKNYNENHFRFQKGAFLLWVETIAKTTNQLQSSTFITSYKRNEDQFKRESVAVKFWGHIAR